MNLYLLELCKYCEMTGDKNQTIKVFANLQRQNQDPGKLPKW